MHKLAFLLWLFSCGMVVTASGQTDTVTTITGLKYVRLMAGNGNKPKVGDKLMVLYTGKLTNGKVFDSSMDNTIPFKFKLGKGDVIPGWDEGFRLMSEGEKAILIVPPHLAYGEQGSGFLKKEDTYVVPPNSTLIFEVELLKVK
jgi:FKBP-type peptidyl-prolyl cis-trans isomerase